MWHPFTRQRDKLSEADRRLREAEADLEKIREETPQYRELAKKLRTIREDNGLGRALTNHFQGH